MKQYRILLLIFTILLIGWGKVICQSGIEPSSFQGTPYKGGLMVGVIPIVDEFTGDTLYLYQHSDTSFVRIDSLVFTDSLRLYTSQGVFTTYIASSGGGQDSTVINAGYGIDVTESPTNTYTVKADTSELVTPHDLSLVDQSNTNEIQTLSQSFTGTTQATATLNLSGGSYIDTTGFMRLETMSSTAGQRGYRYKSNLGAIMGLYEDPSLSGFSNIEILRTGNLMSFGLRTDNATSGKIYKYNGTRWALADDNTGGSGTVTSVGLTLGTSGTDASVSGSPITSSGSFTLNLPSASAANRGLLTSADWTTFNNKFTLPSLTTGSVLFSNGTTIAQDNSNLFWDDTNNNLGIGTVPNTGAKLHINGGDIWILGGSNRRFLMGSGVTAGNWGGMRWNTSNQMQYIHSGYNDVVGVMLTTSDGYTGLRTSGTAPITPLDVFSSNTSDGGTYQNWAYSAGSTNYRLFLKQTVTGGNVRFNFSQVNAGTAYNDVLVFDQGNLGIGVTDATRKVDINGEVRIRDLTTTSPNGLVGKDANGVLSGVTLGTGLSWSGTTLNGAAALSGTVNAIPYFNTTTTLASMPITYSTALPAMVVPTGNAVHLVGTATIIDKNNSYGAVGEILSKASGGGVDWIPVEGTDLSFTTKTGTDVPLVSSTGPGTSPKFRDGTNIELLQVSSSVMSINTNVSYGYMRAASSTISLTTSFQKIAVASPLTNGVITASDANDRFTVSQTGVYEIIYDIDYSYNQNTVIEFKVYKNGGTLINQCDGITIQSTINDSHNISKGAIVQLDASDYIELFTKSGVSCTGTFYNINFTIKRID